ncbi:MAG TPA: hypothetical protein VF881_05750, partial [Polyangiaceae bacterium]
MNRPTASLLLAAVLVSLACSKKDETPNPGPTASPICTKCNDPNHPYCDPADNCVGCLVDVDCGFMPSGGVCIIPGYFCGCKAPDQCASSTIGSKCLASQTCGCDQASDCATSAVGPSCLTD